MNLFPDLIKRYTTETLTAPEAQRLAEFIAFGPAIFQTARLMLKFGILDLLRDSDCGLTIKEIAKSTELSEYAVKCLVEASLSIGLILVDTESERFRISKTGWFIINDPATRVNIDFNHDVNYKGWFYLEDSLKGGSPKGLKTLGNWPTIYEGLSSLPKHVRKSWFGFDHFYSDNSFDKALETVFAHKPKRLLDVGGNTGRWAQRCVNYDSDVEVTILDLPQQIEMMRESVKDNPNSNRIKGLGVNLLAPDTSIPASGTFDAVWMSQFLDCFSEPQVVDILKRITQFMDSQSRLFIMETLWDRQRFETASMCLTLTSLYFTALANGNSKMFHSEDLTRLIEQSGLEIVKIDDFIGQGHSIIECKLKN